MLVCSVFNCILKNIDVPCTMYNAFPESCFYPLVRLDQNLPNLVPWLGFEL